MKILIIPDVHGESFWKEARDLIQDYDKVVFLGDYLDSFFVQDDEMLKNLKQIIRFKKDNMDKVILLLGNHDLSYYDYSTFGCSGYRRKTEEQYRIEITENIDLFDVVFETDSAKEHYSYLFSHAGVIKPWYDTFKGSLEATGETLLGKQINTMTKTKEGLKSLDMVSRYSGGWSRYSSPTWVRPEEIDKDTVMFGYHQFVGHTPQLAHKELSFDNGLQEGSYTLLDSQKAKKMYSLDTETGDLQVLSFIEKPFSVFDELDKRNNDITNE